MILEALLVCGGFTVAILVLTALAGMPMFALWLIGTVGLLYVWAPLGLVFGILGGLFVCCWATQ